MVSLLPLSFFINLVPSEGVPALVTGHQCSAVALGQANSDMEVGSIRLQSQRAGGGQGSGLPKLLSQALGRFRQVLPHCVCFTT